MFACVFSDSSSNKFNLENLLSDDVSSHSSWTDADLNMEIDSLDKQSAQFSNANKKAGRKLEASVLDDNDDVDELLNNL